MNIPNGNYTPLKVLRGSLVEYTAASVPLVLSFEFNPINMTRIRGVSVRSGQSAATRGGYDFSDPSELPRASQGVTVDAESISLRILLDATDRMNVGDPIASVQGVQPEIDVIRSMLEPKVQTPEGARTLSALGQGNERAFARHRYASVLLFNWSIHVLPVFMTQANVEITGFLPNLSPYRAEANLTLQIIESDNPFYLQEVERQFRNAGALHI